MLTRFILLSFIALQLLVVACREKKTTNENVVQSTKQENFIDSAVNRTQDSFALGSSYKLQLRGGVQYKLDQLKQVSEQLNTDDAVLLFYEKYLGIEKELNEDLSGELLGIKKDSLRLLFIDSAQSLARQMHVCAFAIDLKAKTLRFTLDIDSCIVQSKKSKGIEDEKYFMFLKLLYGTSQSQANAVPVYQQVMKGTVYSKIGDNTFLSIAQQLKANQTSYPLFDAFYRKIEDRMNEDLLLKNYMYSKEKVIAEYQRILALQKSDSYIEERVKQRIDEIQSGEGTEQFLH